MLHRLAAKLNQCTEVREIGEAITEELRSLVDYHNCRVYLLEPDARTLLPVAFRGELTEYQGETFDALITEVGRGLTGHVAATHQSYYAPNANDDPYALTIPGTPDLEESILAAPLVFGEELTGVVVLSKLGIDQFDDQDLRVLETAASHAAVAVENCRARADIERALEAEREATRSLRALDEMKNMFLDAVSHELRTPLAAVLGIALTLGRHDVELGEVDRRDLLARLAANARKLDRLLTDLLDLDRLVRGIVEPNRRLTDVGALVRRAVEASDVFADRRVMLDVTPVMASVDPAKVERIVENLLANTARHTPEGTAIWVRVTSRDGGVLIAVDDQGGGVPNEFKRAIFEPFRQGPDRNPHSPGVGIGLSLVARFAELHGGQAWVEDRPGGGAGFRVFLPGQAAGTAPEHGDTGRGAA